MNCKQGDVAIIVRSYAGNEGKIVTCIKLHPPGYGLSDKDHGPVWQVDRNDLVSVWAWSTEIASTNGNTIPDAFLRPIKPDETPDKSIEVMDKLLKIEKIKEEVLMEEILTLVRLVVMFGVFCFLLIGMIIWMQK